MNKILFALLFASLSFSAIPEASAGKQSKEENQDQKRSGVQKKRAPQKVKKIPEQSIIVDPNDVLQEILSQVESMKMPTKRQLARISGPQHLFYSCARAIEEEGKKLDCQRAKRR